MFNLVDGDGVVSLLGELDVKHVVEAHQALAPRLAAPLQLDLSKVELIDTAGVQLVMWLKQQPGAQVRVVAASDPARQAFGALGLAAEVSP